MIRITTLVLALLIAAPSIVRSDDMDEVKRMKERIELLEAKLEIAQRDNDALKKKVEQLEQISKELPVNDETLKEKKVVAPLGSVWKGKFGLQSGEMSVVVRQGKKVTWLIAIENGAKWEFDCEFTNATEYKILDTRRLEAATGIRFFKEVNGSLPG